MRKSFLNRLKVLALVALMGLSLASCGTNEETGEQGNVAGGKTSGDTASEYVYVPEFYPLVVTGENQENTYIADMVLEADRICYTKSVYDPVLMRTSSSLVIADLNNLSTEEVVEVPGLEREGYICTPGLLRLDGENNLYATYYCAPPYEEGKEYVYTEQKVCLVKYDKDRNVVYELDFEDVFVNEYSYIVNMIVDKEGKVYAVSDNIIYVIDATGKPLKPIQTNTDWISQLFVGEDGRVFYTRYSNTGAGMELVEIDTKTNAEGTVFKNLPDMNCEIRLGDARKLLVKGSSQLFEYNTETQESTPILSWLDSYLTSDYIRDFTKLENGDFLIYYEDWSQNTKELVTLRKTKASDLPQKEEVVIASFYQGNQALERAIVDFNKTNTKYKITYKAYWDDSAEWTECLYEDTVKRMNADLTGSNPPDIIDISYVDITNLAVKGVFEDLSPYLEKSTVINKDDFLPNILDGYTIKDKLVTIPRRFRLNTLAGKTSVVGTKNGWTLDEVMALAKRYPEAQLLQYMTPEYALQLCMQYSSDAFIDYENGTSNFDSPEFVKVLEFANCFNSTPDYDSSLPQQLQSNKVLLSSINVSSVEEYIMYQMMFEEPVTNIGFPTADGNRGIILNGSDMYGICALSSNKEGAWAFLETFLQYEKNDMYAWGMSTRVDELEEMFTEAQTPEYERDENGEFKKDEAGNLIEVPKTTWGYDDWEAKIYAASDEQIKEIRALIESARPALGDDEEILKIINEEAAAYFKGQKSAQEVAGVIQSRVSIFVSENS